MSDVQDMVKILNYKLLQSLPEDVGFVPFLKYVDSPVCDYIEYLDIILWDSENDRWELTESREAFEAYLLEGIKNIHDTITQTINILEGKADEHD